MTPLSVVELVALDCVMQSALAEAENATGGPLIGAWFQLEIAGAAVGVVKMSGVTSVTPVAQLLPVPVTHLTLTAVVAVEMSAYQPQI